MERQILKDDWTVTVIGDNVYHIPEEPVPVTVPGSVYSAYLASGMMPDPYWRENELDALKLMENDFVFRTEFRTDPSLSGCDRVILRFDGIDTIADISLNGTFLGHVENMHRSYEFEVESLLRFSRTAQKAENGNDKDGFRNASDFAGIRPSEENDGSAADLNVLEVTIYSPTKYIAAANAKVQTLESTDAMPGYSHLRKAHCMFGWDWGPRLPDAGLYRPVELLGIHRGRISDDIRIVQEHSVIPGDYRSQSGKAADAVFGSGAGEESRNGQKTLVILHVSAGMDPENIPKAHLEYTLVTPEGEERPFSSLIVIGDPELWWPNGYGKQPLYKVVVRLVDDETGEELDRVEKRIGLRTVTVDVSPYPDEKRDPHIGPQAQKDTKEGRHFDFVINGLPIFAMGTDYIPEDNILARVTPERTRKLLEDTAETNANCIRVWGGGYYPDDFFFDICDELGILVWQDFMFACASYDLTDDFEENIHAEFVDVIRRLRHHASLALWSGNNEMETQIYEAEENGTLPHRKQLFDYIKIYEYILPKILKDEDPERFYWPSSPSSGGNYEDANEENMGDIHYWSVWHGGEPFTAYRQHHFRFLSEFGFQSFPCIQTVESFTRPEDRNIFSEVMEMHQRNSAANGRIMTYLAATYRYPKNFESLIYCSQMLQLDAIRYGVEHFRRIRGTCMGTVVWQLNDIWPVASWASIDYFGRWKALQYGEKRFFAPVSITCEEHGRVDQKPFANSLPIPVEYSATLHVANETWDTVHGAVHWMLCRPDSSVILEEREAVTVEPFAGTWLEKHVFNGLADERDMNLFFEFLQADESGNEKAVSRGSCLFAAPKHYNFADPHLTLTVEGDQITVHSEAYAKGVCIDSEDGNLRLSDNFFDMEKGDYTVQIAGKRPESALRVRSVFDIA